MAAACRSFQASNAGFALGGIGGNLQIRVETASTLGTKTYYGREYCAGFKVEKVICHPHSFSRFFDDVSATVLLEPRWYSVLQWRFICISSFFSRGWV